MRISRYLVIGGVAYLLASQGVAAQQPTQPQGPTIEQRVGFEVGPIIVRAAALSAQVDNLKALVEQRDKTIADLQAQIAALKKAAEVPK